MPDDGAGRAQRRTLARARAGGQLLDRPAADVPAASIVRHLLAVQAQDLRAATLAIRVRGGSNVAAALENERSLVLTWLNRGTLHLVAREDYPWLHALTARRQLAANSRRLHQEGVSEADAERGVRAIVRALAAQGPLTRSELAARLASAALPSKGQALYHLLMRAALQGLIVLGPLTERGHAFVLVRDWLGENDPPQHDLALRELPLRSGRAHVDAEPGDLARWAGIAIREARTALKEVPPAPPVRVRRVALRLLPAYDPYMLGWRDRSFAVAPRYVRRIHAGGGVIRPVATNDGLVIGTWSHRGGLDLFEPLSSRVNAALEAELEAVRELVGPKRCRLAGERIV